MPKDISELRGCPTERKRCPKRIKVILKDGRLVEATISPFTRERFPSVSRVKRARENALQWRQRQDHVKAFNRDQWLASELR